MLQCYSIEVEHLAGLEHASISRPTNNYGRLNNIAVSMSGSLCGLFDNRRLRYTSI